MFNKKAPPESFDKLYDFLEENYFSISDMLAVIGASLNRNPDTYFKTHLMVGGQIYKYEITKVDKIDDN